MIGSSRSIGPIDDDGPDLIRILGRRTFGSVQSLGSFASRLFFDRSASARTRGPISSGP